MEAEKKRLIDRAVEMLTNLSENETATVSLSRESLDTICGAFSAAIEEAAKKDMANMTWQAGGEGSSLTLGIEWTDENNLPHKSTVRLIVEQDKPRTVSLSYNGRRLVEDNGREEKFLK